MRFVLYYPKGQVYVAEPYSRSDPNWTHDIDKAVVFMVSVDNDGIHSTPCTPSADMDGVEARFLKMETA